jgi:hypothetical protein
MWTTLFWLEAVANRVVGVCTLVGAAGGVADVEGNAAWYTGLRSADVAVSLILRSPQGQGGPHLVRF